MYRIKSGLTWGYTLEKLTVILLNEDAYLTLVNAKDKEMTDMSANCLSALETGGVKIID